MLLTLFKENSFQRPPAAVQVWLQLPASRAPVQRQQDLATLAIHLKSIWWMDWRIFQRTMKNQISKIVNCNVNGPQTVMKYLKYHIPCINYTVCPCVQWKFVATSFIRLAKQRISTERITSPLLHDSAPHTFLDEGCHTWNGVQVWRIMAHHGASVKRSFSKVATASL